MDEILLVGSAGHAKVIVDIVEKQGKYRIAGFLEHSRPKGELVQGYPVVGQEEDLPQLIESLGIKGILVAIGDNYLRSKVAAKIGAIAPDLPFVTAIHPQATIARDVTIEAGTVVMAGGIVNPACTVGRFCVVNTNASLDHDGVMEDFSSLAPRVATGGFCRIGAYSAIGIGAVLIHRMVVGEQSVVGAGSTVLKPVEPYQVVYGTPAKFVRSRKPGDKYM